MRYGSLFSGIGGLDLAVEAASGATCAWHVEYEAAPSAVLARHWPGTPNLGDVTAVDWSTVEPVDLICGGYPCQPFSHAGKRQGANDVRHLWPYVADAVRHLRPRLVVLENVAGHLSLGFGRVLADLAEMGYVGRWGCVRAADAGMPHRRERVFIIAADAERVADVRVDGDGGVRGAAAAVEAGVRKRERARDTARDGDTAAADAEGRVATDGAGFSAAAGLDERAGTRAGGGDRAGHPAARVRELGRSAAVVAWGPYAAAVERWEQLSGEPAPHPLDGKSLNPDFVRWMMGFPVGWIDGMKRRDALKALGNAVAPSQGELALRLLLGLPVAVAGNGGTLLPTPTARDYKGPNQRGDDSCLYGALLPTPTARLGDARGAQADRYTNPERSYDLDDALAWLCEMRDAVPEHPTRWEVSG